MISELWAYGPEDFLLFSERVYFRLFELHNAAVWPAQIVALILGAVILVFVLRPAPIASRMIALILATTWIFVAWAFLWNTYATINWSIRYVAPLFILQALLLAWFGAVQGRLAFNARSGAGALLGLALFAHALVLLPLTALLEGRPLAAAEIFGITADPTAIGTLGLILMAGRGWRRRLLLVIPLVWCALSAAVLLTMGVWQGWAMLAVIAVALAGALLDRLGKSAGDVEGPSSAKPAR